MRLQNALLLHRTGQAGLCTSRLRVHQMPEHAELCHAALARTIPRSACVQEQTQIMAIAIGKPTAMAPIIVRVNAKSKFIAGRTLSTDMSRTPPLGKIEIPSTTGTNAITFQLVHDFPEGEMRWCLKMVNERLRPRGLIPERLGRRHTSDLQSRLSCQLLRATLQWRMRYPPPRRRHCAAPIEGHARPRSCRP